jgi:hypothetical protein
MQRLKHLKNPSQAIIETENAFDQPFLFKTTDPRT